MRTKPSKLATLYNKKTKSKELININIYFRFEGDKKSISTIICIVLWYPTPPMTINVECRF